MVWHEEGPGKHRDTPPPRHGQVRMRAGVGKAPRVAPAIGTGPLETWPGSQ